MSNSEIYWKSTGCTLRTIDRLEVGKMSNFRIAVILLSIPVSGILSCGGGSEPTGQTGVNLNADNMQSEVFTQPNDALSLQASLHTRYTSDEDFDVWLCNQESATPSFAYALPGAGTLGDGLVGRAYLLNFGGEFDFTWQATGATDLQTISLDGSTVTSRDYQFTSANQMSYVETGVQFDCSRVSNLTAFGGESITDNDPVIIDLAAENSRIPNNNRPVSATSVATFDPIFGQSKIQMFMTFPNGLLTSCVDWDLANQQPRDCGSDFDLGQLSPLNPLSAGQTIDGTFRTEPNQLILTADGDITLGRGVSSSVHGLESTSDLTGSYYINGFTITMEFGERVFHTFIGVNDENNGQVQSLLLANIFFDKN